MSNYHILDGDLDGDATIYTVIFHFPVPNENNIVGINLQTAVSQDPEWPKDSKVPWLSQAHKTQLSNGEVFEWRPWAYKRNASNTLVEDRSAIDAKYTELLGPAQNRIRNRYKFWGFDRDVS